MENTPALYDTLVQVLRQQAHWEDLRHLKTLAWMMVGLIQSGWISLSAWAPYVVSRARYAQSTVRRFHRWLDNDKIAVASLYGPLIQQALAEIRFAEALTRLCFVLAITTLSLVSQGTEVVKQGNCRLVDPHWFRGQSYLKIGWHWVKLALSRGYALITRVHLSSERDPEPAIASRRQYQRCCQSRFAFELPEAA